MPELPEVEIIRLGLSKKITGLTIKKIEILNQKSFQGDPSKVTGSKIIKVWRRAKMLGIDSTGMTLLFHLKMSGQIIFTPNPRILSPKPFLGGHPTKDMLGEMPNKSTRVIFEFGDGSKLYFNDQRKFGWIRLVTSTEVTSHKLISSLGPEPLEKTFTSELLESQLKRRKNTAVKVALLDQQLISGIGNIYACEACFIAGINPQKLVKDLKTQEFQKLLIGIKESLLKSIKYGGSSKQHYFNESGEKGYFLEVANVYARKGEPCRNCQTPIVKIKLGSRGTYYCPKCQH